MNTAIRRPHGLIDDAVMMNHRNISEESERFVRMAIVEGRSLERVNLLAGNVPSVVSDYAYELNSWPVFISNRTRASFAECAIEIPRLIGKVPLAAFDLDAELMSKFYGLKLEFADAFAKHLPRFDMTAHLLTRTDAILTKQGIKTLEINSGSNIGGWQVQFLDYQYRKLSLLNEFINTVPHCESRNILRALFDHIIDSCRARFPEEKVFTWLLVIQKEVFHDGSYAALRELLLHFAATDALNLDVVLVTSVEDTHVRDGYLWLGEKRINALLVGLFSLQVPPNLFDVLLQDHLVWPDNPFHGGPLSDKRNLALLYQHRHSSVFSEAERGLIERYVPWGAPITQTTVEYGGNQRPLNDLLLERQDEFVLKPARGWCGDDVCVGRYVTPEAWTAAVHAATRSGRFLAQAYCEGIPLYAQGSDQGFCLMDFVWGIFACGSHYGGAWVRMVPAEKNTDGVVNSARGAQESIVYEVSS